MYGGEWTASCFDRFTPEKQDSPLLQYPINMRVGGVERVGTEQFMGTNNRRNKIQVA
jgi:hypothetical protein